MIDNQLEYIICSAIWYKELKFPNSKTLGDYNIRPVGCDSGIVFSGWRHLNCLRQMNATTGLRSHEAGEHIEGFITSRNTFVNRTQAAKIALECGQVKELKYQSEKLFSEDLY